MNNPEQFGWDKSRKSRLIEGEAQTIATAAEEWIKTHFGSIESFEEKINDLRNNLPGNFKKVLFHIFNNDIGFTLNDALKGRTLYEEHWRDNPSVYSRRQKSNDWDDDPYKALFLDKTFLREYQFFKKASFEKQLFPHEDHSNDQEVIDEQLNRFNFFALLEVLEQAPTEIQMYIIENFLLKESEEKTD